MKPRQGESYASWADRVRMFEHGRALQRVAQGEDVNLVMEDMSRRIVGKMLHPIYKELQPVLDFDLEENRRKYTEIMNSVGPAADHIDDTLT
jgi:glutamyl-tRNA reductase